MRNYDLIAVLDAKMSEEDMTKKIEDIQKVIVNAKGEVKDIDKWGVKEMATTYKKTNRGFYVVFNYDLDPKNVKKIDNFFKVTEDILIYMNSIARVKKEKVVAKKK